MKIKILSLLLIAFIVTACTAPQLVVSPTANPTATPTTPTATQIPTALPSPTSAPLALAAFEKGPYLVPGADSTSMNVLWQNPDAANYWLVYGTDESYSLGKVTPVSISDDGVEEAKLTGLQAGTHYFYRVTDGKSEATGSFITSNPDAANLNFWVYGDSRNGPQIQDAIDADILNGIASDPVAQSFLLFSGDIMSVASEESLQSNQFDPEYSSTRQMMAEIPMINAMGNHDGTKLFTKYFPYKFAGNFYWSFDYGPVHVAVVDQYGDVSPTSPQWTWLKQDLSSSTKSWKFILLHEPGWSAGTHENNTVVQDIIQPIAYHTGVSIIFAGHNHYYARAEVDGVYQITTGGGGAPLYNPIASYPNIQVVAMDYHYLQVVITGNTLTVTAQAPEGKLLDTFSITH